jgi:FeS assembly protein IscX
MIRKTGSTETSDDKILVDSVDVLIWEDSYAIARALHEKHPEVLLEEVSLGMIYRWTLELIGFDDDPELANEAILTAIYREWFEEVNPI